MAKLNKIVNSLIDKLNKKNNSMAKMFFFFPYIRALTVFVLHKRICQKMVYLNKIV